MTGRAGFTLIEVMVATLITAVLATMGLALLTNALRTQEQLEATMDSVQELELARAVIRRDLSQLVSRRWRVDFGEFSSGDFEGGTDLRGEDLMVFVRNGRITLGRAESLSSLEQVEYAFEDGALIRRSGLHINSAQDVEKRSRVLLSGLEEVRVRFRNASGWSDVWNTPAGGGVLSAPEAVSVEIVHPRYGRLDSVFVTNAVQ